MGKKAKHQEKKKGAAAAAGPGEGPPEGGKNEYGYDSAQYDQALDALVKSVGKLPEGDCYTKEWVATFLRARKLNLTKAADMCRASIEWRQKNNADTVLDGPKPDERILQYHPHGFVGMSRKGGPVYYERSGKARMWKLIGDLTPEAALHWKVWMQEYGGKISRANGNKLGVVVMDIDGLALKNATKPVMDFYQMQGGVDEANYPETLEKVLFLNTNWVFTTLWKVAKYFFAEEVREKVVILGADYEEELQKYIHPDQYPPYLKGSTFKGEVEPWMGDITYIDDLPKLP